MNYSYYKYTFTHTDTTGIVHIHKTTTTRAVAKTASYIIKFQLKKDTETSVIYPAECDVRIAYKHKRSKRTPKINNIL